MSVCGAEIGQKRHWNPFEILIKMRREAPEFKRCCLCLPLRRGLITWGYIKLALDTLLISSMIYIVSVSKFFFMYILAQSLFVLFIFIIQLVILFTDAAFNIVLIVGGHQKSVSLLKGAYIYNMVYLGLLVASCAWATYQQLRLVSFLMSIDASFGSILGASLPSLCLFFALIFVQIYTILLIRSEKQKLEEQSLEMQFTNPSAAEAQCTMHASVGRSDVSDYKSDLLDQRSDVSDQRSDGVQCTDND